MVDINPNASGLRAQLQAQLQAGKTGVGARQSRVDVTPRPQDIIEERIKARSDDTGQNRQLPVKRDSRLNNLSSPEELNAAKQRVDLIAGNNREAPTGRTSTRENELRNHPLGQILDIRV